jgi:hypothetical protein
MAKRPTKTTEQRLYEQIRGRPGKNTWRTPKRIARALAAAAAEQIGDGHLVRVRCTRRIGGRTS